MVVQLIYFKTFCNSFYKFFEKYQEIKINITMAQPKSQLLTFITYDFFDFFILPHDKVNLI